MRNISTLTQKEGAGLWDAVMPDWCKKPFIGAALHFKASDTAPERFCFWSGVERLGIHFDGKVWADSDLQPLQLDQEKVRAYLHDIGILIPSITQPT